MRKMNEQNERIKRRYLQYLKTAQRKDSATVQKAAEGILRFEASTKYADFKRFHWPMMCIPGSGTITRNLPFVTSRI